MDSECSTPEHFQRQMCSDSFKSSKLNLHSRKEEKGVTTPVSSLCESLSSAVLETPVHNFHKANDCLQFDRTSELKACLPSTCQTLNTNLHITPKYNVLTDTISPFKPAILEENINVTPRRNPRRSCAGRISHLDILEEDLVLDRILHETGKASDTSVIHKNSSSHVCTKDDKLGSHPNSVTFCPIEVIATNCTGQNESILSQDVSMSVTDGKIYAHNNDINMEECTPTRGKTLENYNLLKSKIRSEPRKSSRRSDIGVSVHKLTFSAKRSHTKQKSVIQEYDPDNDIFAHGVVPTNFNVDSLKDAIGKFLNCADEPVNELKRSLSCGTLNNVCSSAESSPIQCSSSKKKQPKEVSHVPQKETFKRTASAPNLRTLSTSTKTSEVHREETMRAFLRARDIIMNIQKRKNTCNLKVVEKKNDSLNRQSGSSSAIGENGCRTVDSSFDANDSVSDSDSSFTTPDFSLAPTQPFESIILRDVTAYVEVISNNEDISAGVRTELMKLGATVVLNFNRNVPVTHVVFNDGHISTYKKAKKRNIPLVSVLWIEECRKSGVKVHESLYPPYQIEKYESPSIVKQLKKRRILHFPSEDRPRPSPKSKRGVLNNSVISKTVDLPEIKIPKRKKSSVPKWVEQVAGDNGMMRMLVNMTGISPGEFKDLVKRPPTPDSEISDSESNIDSPLAVRLMRKFAKDLDLPCGSSSIERKQNNSNNTTSPTHRVVGRKINACNEIGEIKNTKSENEIGVYHTNTVIGRKINACYEIEKIKDTKSENEIVEYHTNTVVGKKINACNEIEEIKNTISENEIEEIKNTISENEIEEIKNTISENEIVEYHTHTVVGRKINACNEIEEIKNTKSENEIVEYHTPHVVATDSQTSVNTVNEEINDTNICVNVTERKKISKRKLLTCDDEALSVSGDDAGSNVVGNPHSSNIKRLSCDNLKKKRKCSYSASNCVKNKDCDEGVKVTQDNEENTSNPVRRSRRSSMYFMQNRKSSKATITQKPAVVCTFLHTAEVEDTQSIIGKLGVYVLEKNITEYTTHVIAGSTKRTMKILKGMARGCWIVSYEWVLKSLEADKWLDEEEFELISFSPTVRKYRLEKLSFGALFKPDIFQSCGPIFVSSKSTPPRGDIVELILLCGGRIASRVNKAKVVVGKKYPAAVCVTALWVLDSITDYTCKPFDSYICT